MTNGKEKYMKNKCGFFLQGALAAFGIFCATACGTDKQDFETVDLVDPVLKIDAFSDSTYFSQVSFLLEEGGDLYASDSKRGQVFRLDARDLTLKKTYGRRGQGPQDIMWCWNFGISHDMLAVCDFMGDRVQLFDKHTGDYLASANWLKKNLGVSSGGRATLPPSRSGLMCLIPSSGMPTCTGTGCISW